MKLYLLRHGQAVEAAEVGGSDEARMLTAEGRERTVRAAEAMRRLRVGPGVILTSPLPRALETAELTAGQLEGRPEVRQDKRLRPGATPADCIGAMRDAGGRSDLMLVGHNPDLEQLLGWLIAPDGRARLTMRKGGLAVVEVFGGLESLSRPGAGNLLALWPGKALARMTG